MRDVLFRDCEVLLVEAREFATRGEDQQSSCPLKHLATNHLEEGRLGAGQWRIEGDVVR